MIHKLKDFVNLNLLNLNPKSNFPHISFSYLWCQQKAKNSTPPPPTPTSKIIQFWSDTLPHNTTDIHNWTLNDLPSLRNISISSLYALTLKWNETLRWNWKESKHMLPESTFIKVFHTSCILYQRTTDQKSLKETV